jgi:hypothetical protein
MSDTGFTIFPDVTSRLLHRVCSGWSVVAGRCNTPDHIQRLPRLSPSPVARRVKPGAFSAARRFEAVAEPAHGLTPRRLWPKPPPGTICYKKITGQYPDYGGERTAPGHFVSRPNSLPRT